MKQALPEVQNTLTSGLRFDGVTQRGFLLGAGVLSAAALWERRPAFARQTTPVASPVATNRDWRNEQWVGAWAASPHTPIEGLPEEFPSQRFAFNDQSVRQIVRASIGGDHLHINDAGYEAMAKSIDLTLFRDV
jgi:hypothetical protein